jgi:hypothetical protein
MLTHDELVDIYRSLRATPVLSVYLDGRDNDFSERKAWRRRFDHLVEAARAQLGADSVGDFDAALGKIQGALSGFDNFLPDRGWVGFATAEGLVHGSAVRVPMPDLVRWEPGIRVAPYVRALKQERPVLGVLVDSRRARIFGYREGVVQEVEDLHSDLDLGDLSDTNMSRRGTGSSGVRGETATDAARNFLQVGEERLLKHLAERIVESVGRQGHLVLGGPHEAVGHLRDHLSSAIRDRSIERAGLHLEMSEAEVRAAIEAAATELSQASQARLLSEVIDLARSGGKGALGSAPVDSVLRENRVDTLLLSRGFIAENGEIADHLVGAAFEQGAEVEEVSGEAAARLDAEGQGVAARLRYTL